MNELPQRTNLDTRVEPVDIASGLEVVHCASVIPDLAPSIVRQRLVIEGTCQAPIDEEQIKIYLRTLSGVCGMRQLTEPVTHLSEQYGWAGWVHWENSGCHFYAWDEPQLFFSVDIYTCETFDAANACRFTKVFFDSPRLVAMSF